MYFNQMKLLSATLCNDQSLKYIMVVCKDCQNFPKIDDLEIHFLKCSKSCLNGNSDGSGHNQSKTI